MSLKAEMLYTVKESCIQIDQRGRLKGFGRKYLVRQIDKKLFEIKTFCIQQFGREDDSRL